jgi:hypothetical protein
MLLAGCRGRTHATEATLSAGDRLERAAVAAGLVIDPASRSIAGAWSLDTDRACIVPAAETGGDERIGLLIDYGQGQGCAASGTVRRSGDRLDMRLGACRVTARFDGERIVFPGEVPAACDRLCTGRASLAAMTVERQSGSVAEARSLRTPKGEALCGA